jgi:hypothetical protein
MPHLSEFVSLDSVCSPSPIVNYRAAGIQVSVTICITTIIKAQRRLSICRHIGIFGPQEDLTGKNYSSLRRTSRLHHSPLPKRLSPAKPAFQQFSIVQKAHLLAIRIIFVDLFQDLRMFLQFCLQMIIPHPPSQPIGDRKLAKKTKNEWMI